MLYGLRITPNIYGRPLKWLVWLNSSTILRTTWRLTSGRTKESSVAECALLKTHDKGSIPLGPFLDFQKAFDNV